MQILLALRVMVGVLCVGNARVTKCHGNMLGTHNAHPLPFVGNGEDEDSI